MDCDEWEVNPPGRKGFRREAQRSALAARSESASAWPPMPNDAGGRREGAGTWSVLPKRGFRRCRSSFGVFSLTGGDGERQPQFPEK